jgi:four helix bundle protein
MSNLEWGEFEDVNNLTARTKKFALDVIRLCAGFPHGMEFQIITRQLMRSATSVAANYRSACRGRSKADFINKLSTVEEEADESALWLEMLADLVKKENLELARLTDEANQLTAIMVSSKKTARDGNDRKS